LFLKIANKPGDFSTTIETTATTPGPNLSHDPNETQPDNNTINNTNLSKTNAKQPVNPGETPANPTTTSTSGSECKEAATLVKWPCSSCTYQNWPKSQHCVMCNVQRNINIEKTTQDTVSNSLQANSTSSGTSIDNKSVNSSSANNTIKGI